MREFKKAYITMPQWFPFYTECICKGKGIIDMLHTERTVRINRVNEELAPYHARLEKQYIIFESKAHYNWFVMRWS